MGPTPSGSSRPPRAPQPEARCGGQKKLWSSGPNCKLRLVGMQFVFLCSLSVDWALLSLNCQVLRRGVASLVRSFWIARSLRDTWHIDLQKVRFSQRNSESHGFYAGLGSNLQVGFWVWLVKRRIWRIHTAQSWSIFCSRILVMNSGICSILLDNVKPTLLNSDWLLVGYTGYPLKAADGSEQAPYCFRNCYVDSTNPNKNPMQQNRVSDCSRLFFKTCSSVEVLPGGAGKRWFSRQSLHNGASHDAEGCIMVYL